MKPERIYRHCDRCGLCWNVSALKPDKPSYTGPCCVSRPKGDKTHGNNRLHSRGRGVRGGDSAYKNHKKETKTMNKKEPSIGRYAKRYEKLNVATPFHAGKSLGRSRKNKKSRG